MPGNGRAWKMGYSVVWDDRGVSRSDRPAHSSRSPRTTASRGVSAQACRSSADGLLRLRVDRSGGGVAAACVVIKGSLQYRLKGSSPGPRASKARTPSRAREFKGAPGAKSAPIPPNWMLIELMLAKLPRDAEGWRSRKIDRSARFSALSSAKISLNAIKLVQDCPRVQQLADVLHNFPTVHSSR